MSKSIRSLLGVFSLLSPFALAAPPCQVSAVQHGPTQQRIKPIAVSAQCGFPEAQGVTLSELREVLKAQISDKSKLVEGPVLVHENGLSGTRILVDYQSAPNQGVPPGLYELFMLDDGATKVDARLASLQLRGRDFQSLVKMLAVRMQSTLGPTISMSVELSARIERPAWIGLDRLFERLVDENMPPLMGDVLRDVEREIDRLR